MLIPRGNMFPYNLTYETSYQTQLSSSAFLPLILLSMAGQKHTPSTTTAFKDEYDFIIVGAGSAGSAVASRLSEIDCVTILLLEAGKSPPKVTDIPVVYNYFASTDLDWQFRTLPQKHCGDGLIDRSVTLSAGKAVGGTSILNGMQAIRGNRKDFDEWAKQGATGWSYNEVFPYFIKLEDDPEFFFNGYHGIGGPVSVSTPKYNSELESAVYQAATDMGYDILDSNGPKQTGFNIQQATLKNGQRCSSAKAYLVPIENKENIDIVENAYVKKIMINNGRAEGVEFDFEGRPRAVRARKEVILSAGAIKSPHILLLSGIGPKEELNKHNIPVKADLPVGQNLQEHWGGLLNFALDPHRVLSFNNKLMSDESIIRYVSTKTGPITALAATTNMGFLNKDGDEGTEDYPDYQIYFGEGMDEIMKHKCTMTDEFYRAIYGPYENKPFYWCLPLILHPKSRGVVTLNTTDPYDQPLINPNYYSDLDDLAVVVAGLKKCKEFGTSKALRILGSKPFETVYPGCEDQYGADEDYFPCVAKAIMLSASHQAGTVKMGSLTDKTAVLDPQLRVKGIQNLRVVDASVMPNITSGNTYIPTVMIAEKASDMIKEGIQCGAKGTGT